MNWEKIRATSSRFAQFWITSLLSPSRPHHGVGAAPTQFWKQWAFLMDNTDMSDFPCVDSPKRVELNAVAGFVALWLRVHVQAEIQAGSPKQKKILLLEVPGFFRVYLGFEEVFSCFYHQFPATGENVERSRGGCWAGKPCFCIPARELASAAGGCVSLPFSINGNFSDDNHDGLLMRNDWQTLSNPELWFFPPKSFICLELKRIRIDSMLTFFAFLCACRRREPFRSSLPSFWTRRRILLWEKRPKRHCATSSRLVWASKLRER